MGKKLRRVLLFILVMASTYMLASLCAPKSSVMVEDVMIYAGMNKVSKGLLSTESWEVWDPWMFQDSNQKRKKIGIRGKQGYGFEWKGKNVGKLSLVEKFHYDSVIFKLVRGKGFLSTESELRFRLSKKGNATLLHLQNTTDYTFWQRLKTYVNPLYAKEMMHESLHRFKSFVEKGDDAIGVSVADGVTITSVHGVNYAIVRDPNVAKIDLDQFAISSVKKVYTYMQDNGLAAKGPPCRLHYSFDDNSGFLSIAVGVPISELLVGELKSVTDASVAFDLGEDYAEIQQRGKSTFPENVFMHLSEQNYEVEFPIVEFFVVGPMHTDRKDNYKTKWQVHYSD